jgi:hypothetical protein
VRIGGGVRNLLLQVQQKLVVDGKVRLSRELVAWKATLRRVHIGGGVQPFVAGATKVGRR